MTGEEAVQKVKTRIALKLAGTWQEALEWLVDNGWADPE